MELWQILEVKSLFSWKPDAICQDHKGSGPTKTGCRIRCGMTDIEREKRNKWLATGGFEDGPALPCWNVFKPADSGVGVAVSNLVWDGNPCFDSAQLEVRAVQGAPALW